MVSGMFILVVLFDCGFNHLCISFGMNAISNQRLTGPKFFGYKLPHFTTSTLLRRETRLIENSRGGENKVFIQHIFLFGDKSGVKGKLIARRPSPIFMHQCR